MRRTLDDETNATAPHDSDHIDPLPTQAIWQEARLRRDAFSRSERETMTGSMLRLRRPPPFPECVHEHLRAQPPGSYGFVGGDADGLAIEGAMLGAQYDDPDLRTA